MRTTVDPNTPEEDFARRFLETYPDKPQLRDDHATQADWLYRRLYDALAGLFGVDIASEPDRLREGERLLHVLYAQSNHDDLVQKAIRQLASYTFVASGVHRYTPIGLAIRNGFLGQSLLKDDGIDEMIADTPEFSYLRDLHPLYARPEVYPVKKPAFFPVLKLKQPIAKKKYYRVLDIGSAPKQEGSPPLNALKAMLDKNHFFEGVQFEVMGTDVFYPLFREESGQVTVLQAGGLYHKLNGIRYYNPLVASAGGQCIADVMSDDFDPRQMGEQAEGIDFLIVSFVLHHLVKETGEHYGEFPIADVPLMKEDGTPFQNKYLMAESQTAAITRMLNSLADGGVLFLNFMPPYRATPELKAQDMLYRRMWLQHYRDKSNSDVFLVIQRTGDQFVIYEQGVSCRPGGERYESESFLLQGGEPVFTTTKIGDVYRGAEPGTDIYERIAHLFRRADMVVYRYQGINQSRWGSMLAAAERVSAEADLPEILNYYMRYVPDEEPLKKKILRDAHVLHQDLMSRWVGTRSESRKFPSGFDRQADDFCKRFAHAYPDKPPLKEEQPHPEYGVYRQVYDAVAGLFGVDYPKSGERLSEGLKLLRFLYRQENREELLSIAIRHLENYTFLASGAHRYAGIGLAVRNHLKGQNLFDDTSLDDVILRNPAFGYLRRTHPFYATPQNGVKKPAHLPQLHLMPMPRKKAYRVLDIGSAPKHQGSPPLNALKDFLDDLALRDPAFRGVTFEVMGTDVFYPVFRKSGERVTVRRKKTQSTINGIRYFNPLVAETDGKHVADVMSDDFDPSRLGDHAEGIDFAIVSMTFQHLVKDKGEQYGRFPMATVPLRWETGDPFAKAFYMAKSQQRAMTHLLKGLNDGGVLFLNFKTYYKPTQELEEQPELLAKFKREERHNSGTFLVIQRAGNEFIVHHQVVQLHPKNELFNSERYLLRGAESEYTLKKLTDLHPNLDANAREAVKTLYRRADLLVEWYQGLNQNRWTAMTRGAEAMEKRGATIPKILKAYMSFVPDAEPVKAEILRDAEILHSQLREIQAAARSEVRGTVRGQAAHFWFGADANPVIRMDLEVLTETGFGDQSEQVAGELESSLMEACAMLDAEEQRLLFEFQKQNRIQTQHGEWIELPLPIRVEEGISEEALVTPHEIILNANLLRGPPEHRRVLTLALWHGLRRSVLRYSPDYQAHESAMIQRTLQFVSDHPDFAAAFSTWAGTRRTGTFFGSDWGVLLAQATVLSQLDPFWQNLPLTVYQDLYRRLSQAQASGVSQADRIGIMTSLVTLPDGVPAVGQIFIENYSSQEQTQSHIYFIQTLPNGLKKVVRISPANTKDWLATDDTSRSLRDENLRVDIVRNTDRIASDVVAERELYAKYPQLLEAINAVNGDSAEGRRHAISRFQEWAEADDEATRDLRSASQRILFGLSLTDRDHDERVRLNRYVFDRVTERPDAFPPATFNYSAFDSTGYAVRIPFHKLPHQVSIFWRVNGNPVEHS
ncbi:MAG: hypothetical protein PHS88_11650, partial [Candidatus Omnitrophica bacterium]|nr:hypothetical protein [Candidatus Omnitrophota bacterium]